MNSEKSQELEQEAIALVRRALWIPADLQGILIKLSKELGWKELPKEPKIK